MGYTILVVEDSPDTRELMKIILEFEGYRVLEAENGVAAVQMAQHEHSDAILMDMSLPPDGWLSSYQAHSPGAGT